MIFFSDVQIGYKKEEAITLNFKELGTGLIYLIGANGSGKSTLLKTIFGEIKPIDGTIQVNGVDIKNYNTKEKARVISYMSTEIPQVDYLKVDDFLALSKTPYMNVFGQTEKISLFAKDIFKSLDLEPLLNKKLTELSDGEKQIFNVLKNLNQDTQIILLDEPTSFLDPKNKRMLMQFLQDFAVKNNKTIIISTHDIEITLLFPNPYLVVQKKSISLFKEMDLNSILEIY